MRKTLVVCFLCCSSLLAQETPAANRVAWMAIFPEPLPDGMSRVGLEMTSQFLRPSSEQSADGRTFARLDGEEWQLTTDFAKALGEGRLNVRLRLVDRSGGVLDAAIQSFHKTFGMPDGGREQIPNGRLAYHLERDGRLVANLDKPGLHLMDTDVAYVFPFGDLHRGARVGASIQLPTGERDDFSGSGGWDSLVGAAAWRQYGHWKIHGQAEQVFIQLSENNPYRAVLGRNHFRRFWAGAGWQGDGPGFWKGLGLDVTLAYNGSPYHVGIDRIDDAGLQQHWVITHRALPAWRFGLSEEAGSYAAPDMTVFVARTF